MIIMGKPAWLGPLLALRPRAVGLLCNYLETEEAASFVSHLLAVISLSRMVYVKREENNMYLFT